MQVSINVLPNDVFADPVPKAGLLRFENIFYIYHNNNLVHNHIEEFLLGI